MRAHMSRRPVPVPWAWPPLLDTRAYHEATGSARYVSDCSPAFHLPISPLAIWPALASIATRVPLAELWGRTFVIIAASELGLEVGTRDVVVTGKAPAGASGNAGHLHWHGSVFKEGTQQDTVPGRPCVKHGALLRLPPE